MLAQRKSSCNCAICMSCTCKQHNCKPEKKKAKATYLPGTLLSSSSLAYTNPSVVVPRTPNCKQKPKWHFADHISTHRHDRTKTPKTNYQQHFEQHDLSTLHSPFGASGFPFFDRRSYTPRPASSLSSRIPFAGTSTSKSTYVAHPISPSVVDRGALTESNRLSAPLAAPLGLRSRSRRRRPLSPSARLSHSQLTHQWPHDPDTLYRPNTAPTSTANGKQERRQIKMTETTSVTHQAFQKPKVTAASHPPGRHAPNPVFWSTSSVPLSHSSSTSSIITPRQSHSQTVHAHLPLPSTSSSTHPRPRLSLPFRGESTYRSTFSVDDSVVALQHRYGRDRVREVNTVRRPMERTTATNSWTTKNEEKMNVRDRQEAWMTEAKRQYTAPIIERCPAIFVL